MFAYRIASKPLINFPFIIPGYNPCWRPETRRHWGGNIHAALFTSQTGWSRGCADQMHPHQVIIPCSCWRWHCIMPAELMLHRGQRIGSQS